MAYGSRVEKGDRHNYLTATGDFVLDLKYKTTRHYEWICDCGTATFKRSVLVRSGQSKTCGNIECFYAKQNRRKVLPGCKFNHLTVTGNHNNGINGRKGKSEFKCDCGNITYALLQCVKRGTTKSCGRSGCPYNSSVSNGALHIHRKESYSWAAMKSRCDNPNATGYKNYGGRGITYCKEFERFEDFLSYMGKAPSEDHSIDRIDNDGNYEPGNVRWATPREQTDNRRVTKDMKYIELDLALYPNDTYKRRSLRLNMNANTLYYHVNKYKKKILETIYPINITEI